MTINIIALGLIAAVSILVPLAAALVVFIKSPYERKGSLISFFAGGCIGLVFEWFIKEQGLKWLFNHTDLQGFVNGHYLIYILCVSAAGALLAVIPEYLVIAYGYKRQMSFAKAVMMGLGFAMAEAVALAGYRSMTIMVEMLKNADAELQTDTKELFLSSFERCLMLVINVAIVAALVFFVENKMPVRGCIIAMICMVMASFVPGFLIAFSTKDYLQIYTRDTALWLVYIVLSVMALCGIVTLNGLKYSLNDKRTDAVR